MLFVMTPCVGLEACLLIFHLFPPSSHSSVGTPCPRRSDLGGGKGTTDLGAKIHCHPFHPRKKTVRFPPSGSTKRYPSSLGAIPKNSRYHLRSASLLPQARGSSGGWLQTGTLHPQGSHWYRLGPAQRNPGRHIQSHHRLLLFLRGSHLGSQCQPNIHK